MASFDSGYFSVDAFDENSFDFLETIEEMPVQLVQKRAFGRTVLNAGVVSSRLNYGKLIGRTVHNIKTVSDTVQNGN